MATITEDYVSFETAELLKEKGFDIPVRNHYENDGDEIIIGDKYDTYNWNNSPMGHISAPTHQMAMKWLREVYKILILIKYDHPIFSADIYNIDEIDEYGCAKHIPPIIANCKTYEEAVEAALKYILLNITWFKL